MSVAISSTEVTSALAAWRDVDLPGLQRHLEDVVGPLTDLQTSSLQSRKQLADKTREFKKLPDDAKIQGYKPLLKAYQSEIDELTKRAREAEGGVRQVDERLRGVVDPYSILNRVIDRLADLGDLQHAQNQNEQLTKEITLLKERSASVEARDIERAQLSDRLSTLEKTLDSKVQQARESAESEITARFDERLSNAQAKEAELVRSLSLAQEQLKQLRSSHESATERLLTSSSSAAGQASSSSAEHEMLASDLQRARERVATVEKRNEQLREEVEKVKSGEAEEARIHVLTTKIQEAEDEKRRLQALLDNQDERSTEKIANIEARAHKAERHFAEVESELSGVKAKLQAQSDYSEVKRELEIMRLVEFSSGIDDEEANGEALGAKPLEALLLAKNKRLEDELTTLRVAHNEHVQLAQSSSKDTDRLNSEVKRLQQLNEKLESDLLAVGSSAPASARSKAQVNGKPQSAEEALEEMGRIENGELDVAASAASTVGDHPKSGSATASSSSQTNASNTAAPASSSSSDSSVLPIIISQRDRFRSRNAELEEELRKQFEVVTQLRNDVKSLQSDNLSLYEKVRYLQSYSASGSAANRMNSSQAVSAAARDEHRFPPSSPAHHHHREHATRVPMNIASGSTGSSEDKWRDRYEQSVNPFEAFRDREQSRALSSLNPLERLLHMFTRLVLADRRMRILFVSYAIGMHLFIFAILVDYTFYGSTASHSDATAANIAAISAGYGGAAPMNPVS